MSERAVRTVVLLIDELEVWGGTETHLLRLLQQLDRDRLRCVVAVVGRAALVPEFRGRGVPVQALEIHRALAPEGLLGLAKIAVLLCAERAELLVTYHTAADLLGPIAARLVGVPVVSCRRDDGFTKKPLHVRLQRLLNRLVRGMIVVSHFVAEVVERTEGFPRERAQVIWNGEDLTRFAPGPSPARAELELPSTALVATCVGSLTPVKDHATQLEALAALPPDLPLCLLLVGDGPERASLEERAARLGLGPRRLRFLGHRRDVPELLRASDLYVQTSLTEGFSNAVVQAMATGLPVVTTAVGGNRELVPPECGVLVPARDVAALARALAALAGDPDRRRRLGAAARQRVERWCTLAVMTTAYEDAFARAIEGRFPGPSTGGCGGEGKKQATGNRQQATGNEDTDWARAETAR